MGKFQLKGVKSLPADPVKIRMVEKISGKRASDIFHMDTDLMRSSGIQMKFHKGISIIDIQPFIMGDSGFSMLKIYFSGNYRIIHSGDRCGNSTFFRRNPVCERKISAPDLTIWW